MRLYTLLQSSLTGLCLMFPSASLAEELRVWNWSDYIDPTVLESFEAETGIDLIYDVFDSNEMVETRLLAGGSGYDVVVQSAAFLQRQIPLDMFLPLDKAQLPNLANVWDVIADRTAVYDPENGYSINYMWGTTGIGVNLDQVTAILGPDAPIDSLDLIFDPDILSQLAPCGVHLLDAPTEMVPAALAWSGLNPDRKDSEALAIAEAALAAIRPHVRAFHSSAYISALARGEICVAFGWSGDVLQARDRADEAGQGVRIAYHPPREGALMWFDQMAIPNDAPNPDAAHRFLDYILRPGVIAAASNYVNYANGNLASQALLDPGVLSDPAIYPDSAALEKLYTITPFPPRPQRQLTRLWTRVKSGL